MALAAVACGAPVASQPGLISDREIGELQQELVPPAQTPTQAASGKTFYVRLAWGFLAGNEQPAPNVDWSGSLSVDQGTVQLSQLTYFEGGDRPVAQNEPSKISWVSQTNRHFDGLVARVEVPSDDATLTFDTSRFHHEFRASELTGGDDAVFPVDALGQAVSVSSVPASSCQGGFVLGYLRPGQDGLVAFGGRITDRTGAFAGRARFEAVDDGTIAGNLVGEDGRSLAVLRGTLVSRDMGGGSFSAEMVDPRSGRALGSLTGIYASPQAASRGEFEGTFEQVCSEQAESPPGTALHLR